MTDRAVAAFADWFGSARCVVQTTIACLLFVAVEAEWPRIDPSNLHYLYALTVYSAVTQPALAYAAARFSEQLLEILRDVKAALDLLKGIAATVLKVAESDEAKTVAIVAQVEAIYTAVGTLDATVDEVLRLAHAEAEIAETLRRQDENALAALTAMREMLEGQAALAKRLVKPLDEQLQHGGNPADPLRS